MARRTRRRTIYRDSKTGRFARKSTWARSRSHGGTRYRKQRVKVSKPKLTPSAITTLKEFEAMQDLELEFETEEIGGGADYDEEDR